VDAQLLEWPIVSQISYRFVWDPPSGGIDQSFAGMVAAQEGILRGWVLAEWLVLLFLYCCFLLAFRESGGNEIKKDVRN